MACRCGHAILPSLEFASCNNLEEQLSMRKHTSPAPERDTFKGHKSSLSTTAHRIVLISMRGWLSVAFSFQANTTWRYS